MPGFDRTGPRGLGEETGRGLGRCGLGLGRGNRFGMGRGLGRGLGRCFNWIRPQSQADQKQTLVDYRKALEEELIGVKKREKELGNKEK